MIKEYLGFRIVCDERSDWENTFRSNYLEITQLDDKPKDRYNRVICSMWWPRKIKDGINQGIKLVDQHVKAMTITPGKG